VVYSAFHVYEVVSLEKQFSYNKILKVVYTGIMNDSLTNLKSGTRKLSEKVTYRNKDLYYKFSIIKFSTNFEIKNTM
jgi:hypothetical protein